MLTSFKTTFDNLKWNSINTFLVKRKFIRKCTNTTFDILSWNRKSVTKLVYSYWVHLDDSEQVGDDVCDTTFYNDSKEGMQLITAVVKCRFQYCFQSTIFFLVFFVHFFFFAMHSSPTRFDFSQLIITKCDLINKATCGDLHVSPFNVCSCIPSREWDNLCISHSTFKISCTTKH